jgi:aminoglycoside phosphotransferase (APT) family kinase protein
MPEQNEKTLLQSKVLEYLKEKDPLHSGLYEIELLPTGHYHTNFKITADGTSFVLRLSVMQLSRKSDQIQKEFDVLSYLEPYGIAPSPKYLDLDGFEYPLLIEEFISGETPHLLNDKSVEKFGRAISSVNTIPLKDGHPFETRIPNYIVDLEYYANIWREIQNDTAIEIWKKEVDEFTEQLCGILVNRQSILDSVKPALIRRDANPTNFIDIGDKYRVIDWEVARVDDPSITLASFLNEVELYDFFKEPLDENLRNKAIQSFLDETKIPNFDELLKTRLLLERIWGLIWALERIVKFKNGEIPDVLQKDSLLERYELIARRSRDALVADLKKIK